jgi:two-component system CheB/CheR fusion protein
MRAQYNELMGAREALRALTNELEEKVRIRTQALSESEERFRLITTGSNDALWDWNMTFNTFWWSESFFKQFGYKDVKRSESYLFWINAIGPDERSKIRESLDNAINSGQTQWSAEHSFLKADGSFAKVLDRAYILKDEYGTPYRILGSMLDISQLREAQQDAAAFEAYSRKLEAVNVELEQSNHALQQFASGASHDLKEPLRKIEVFSGLLDDEITDKRLSDYIGRVKNASVRMTSLINDLLEYSSLANIPAFEKVDLNEVLDQVCSDLEVAIRERAVVIDCDPLPPINAVPGQIRQVFQNILSNAIKFTAPDTMPQIRIHCRRVASKQIDAPTNEAGEYIQLNIQDNGLGFSAEYASKIFIIFQRLHGKDKYPGTGIGLAIVKKIMDVHQGLVGVSSEPGKGTTFKLLFPIDAVPSDSELPRNTKQLLERGIDLHN